MVKVKWVLAVVAACMLAAVVYVGGRASAQAPAAQVVRAQRIELVDAQGHVTVALGTVGDTTGLVLYDKDGKPRGVLGVDENGGAGLGLMGKNGKRGAVVAVNPPDWNPGITLLGDGKDQRVTLELRSDGSASLDMRGGDGWRRVVMSTGSPNYPLRAPDAIARQPALPLGRGPSLELSDNEGIRRAALTLLPDGNPSLVMWDQEEKQSWKAP